MTTPRAAAARRREVIELRAEARGLRAMAARLERIARRLEADLGAERDARKAARGEERAA